MDEYFRWREVLREQIEKELDYQVGMRLAGGTRMVVKSSSSTRKVEHELLAFSRRRTELKQRDGIFNAPTGSTLESVTASRQSPTTQCIDHKQSPRARIMNERRKDQDNELHQVARTAPRIMNERGKYQGNELHQVARTAPRIFSTIEGTRDLNTVTIARENLGSKVSMLFSYVNSKYGTPVDQLQHLSSSGCFKSGSIESSGDGSGSVIFFPPEANITLPTPTHSVNTSPILFPLKLGIESSHISNVISPAGRLNLENSHGQLKEKAPTPNLRLQFESRFEGGNLQQAIEIGPQEYKLILQPDFYCKRHMQWFYFKVYGMQANIPYHFHIVNLQKPDSLYNHGMQPLLYSEKDAECGWTRVGYNITYSKNSTPSSVMNCDKDLFTLSWTMEFPHSEDHCFLAHCFPYPFSKLLGFIKDLQLSPTKAPYVQCQELCKTLAGNTCPLLTITDFQDVSNMSSRGGVLVTARVHPGESNSSWMMQGLINWLTSDTPHAEVLRRHFVFKLIPMLNPDGVIVGNSRTSLAGVDLNRTYKKPRRDLFPTVFHTKALLGSFMQEREVVLYTDLHGHSRKQNVFTYGCGSTKSDHYQFLNERIFPFLLSRQLPNMFCFRSCKYSVQRCKESTGRVVAWRMGLGNAFTLESTFCGSILGQTVSWQFCERDLEDIGHGLGEAIYCYHRMVISNRYKQKVLSELAEVLLRKCDSSARDVELPDIVQSAVHQQRPSAANRRDINEPTGNTRRTSHSANKTLREFMKCELSHLEVESSTTGSDSENDEIEYLGTKKSKQQRRRRRRQRSIQRSTTLPSLQPPLANQHTSTHRDRSIQMHESNSHIKSVASICETTWSGQVRGKCSDIGKRVPQDQQINGKEQTWRFVNRYAHRSNGGIPIFSEERLKERAKKLQHQPQTSNETPTDQNPRTHILWQPEDSSVQMVTVEPWRGGSEQGCVSSSGASQRGYMTISRLEKPPAVACNKTSTSITGKRVSSPVLTGQMDRIRQKLLREMQQLERTKTHQRSGLEHGYTNKTTLKLPTHLAKYISEIWKSSIQ